jgi:hypothetical protein
MGMVDVSAAIGYCPTTVNKILKLNKVKKHPRGPRSAPKDSYDDAAFLAFKSTWDKLDSTVKGTICEGYAKLKLSELGLDIWEPSCQNHRTDFVVLSGSGLKRIQVKAGTYDVKTKCFRANFTRHRRGGNRSDYNPEDVDFFMIYCAGMPTLSLYVIPAEQIRGKNRCPRLFPHRDRFSNVPTGCNLEPYLNAFHLISESL